MFAKLANLEQQYLELESQLSLPEVLSDQDRYKKLAKAHADLGEIIATYREYRRLEQDLENNKLLLEDPEMRELAQVEIEAAETALPALEEQLKVLLLPKDPLDEKNIIMEIRAGTGGDEAGLFAGDLYRMYMRLAERMRWKTELLNLSESGDGIKEVSVSITGERVYSRLKYESGTHRVQRVPATESQGRIHTSAVTVAVLPEAEELDVHIDPNDLRIDVYRAGGAGGQHVNKTESAVRITHLPTGIVATCQDDKSQHKNKAKAMKVLMARLLQSRQDAIDSEYNEARRSQVGSGDRSERIRTYNFPQGRVTDHRIGLTLYRLVEMLDGDINEMIDGLVNHFQAEALKQQASVA